MSSELILRKQHYEGPFAVVAHIKNGNRLLCLSAMAEQRGLKRGMGLADARSFCPEIQTVEHNLQADVAFQNSLVRWAKRYCPWVGKSGIDGLSLDVAGSAHLFGGEDAMLHDMRARLIRSKLTVRIGLADTVGAAWALARFGEGCAEGGGQAKPLARYLSPAFVSALKRTRRYSDWASKPLGNWLTYRVQQSGKGLDPPS